MALNVLDKVVYYSSDMIDETLEYQINMIIEENPGQHIYILPSGNVGKSGHAMAYHAKKVIEKLNLPESVLSLLNLKNLKDIKKDAVIALLDDFSGTGESIKKFYEKNVKGTVDGEPIKVCALTVAYMEKAEKTLQEDCGIEMYGTLHKPAFVRRGSVFGYEKSMIQVRDFCFKKGEMLLPNWKNEDLKPLGYRNSQALVCFEHTTPNNTLPILWYEMEIPETDKITAGWHTHELMVKKRAFEEQEYVLNVAAQIQQCSYETKGIQKLLYFEKNESSKERIAVEASVMMYEWCEDLNELTGKKYQDIAQRLLSQAALAKTRIARKKLADFFKQEKPVLSEIRHNTGAHREHDFMKQMEVLEGVGWSDTIERLHRFEEVTLELGKTMKPLMDAGLKKIGEAFGK